MIYHITTQSEWAKAQENGVYQAPSLASQGFIHLSKREQITKVANAIYTGQTDLVLLCVDESKLDANLRFEPPDTMVPAAHYDGELFPHVYGTINLNAVSHVIMFPPNDDDTFTLPETLP